MKVEQLYTQCLAEAAYFIESNGEAAVIDPLREAAPYLELEKQYNTKIKYIFETHFHADFVSGHVELAAKTGATIIYGPTAQPEFEAYIARDEEVFQIGKAQIKLMHTPGHTLESSTYLLIDEEGNDSAIFTGDTLFLGDVGRPDLAVKSDLSKEDLAGLLYDSLHKKIMPLADNITVYPGHGKGSACGKSMSDATIDSLGSQKQFNYALRKDLTKDEFIREVTADLVAPPQYFPKNAQLNKKGIGMLDDVLERGARALSPVEFSGVKDYEQALVLDTRSKEAFTEAHIPGALFIGLNTGFAPWVGTLIKDLNQPILIVSEPGREEEVVTRLARVGYDNSLGYLSGGMVAWEEAGLPVSSVAQVLPEDFADIADSGARLLDVRKESEYDSQHVVGARNFPLDFIHEHIHELDPEQHYYIHCAGGYRSVIAASIMLAAGFSHVVDIQSGFSGLKNTNLVITAYTEPVSLL